MKQTTTDRRATAEKRTVDNLTAPGGAFNTSQALEAVAPEKAKAGPVNLRLDRIRMDGGTQPREKIDDATVDEYARDMKAGDKFPPVVVFYDGTAYWLADGFHRCKAASKLREEEITADVHMGALRDAVLYSASANAVHGMRRTNEDKRRAVLKMLEDREWRAWSDREIARQCNVSRELVGDIRAGNVTVRTDSEPPDAPSPVLTVRNDSENKPRRETPKPKGQTTTYRTRHGTIATMDTGNIGKRKTPAKTAGRVTISLPRETAAALLRILRTSKASAAREAVQQLKKALGGKL